MLRAVILDFDGVIVESNDVKTEAFRDVFGQFPEHAAEMMAFHHENVSLTRFAKFDHLLERLGRPGDAELRGRLAADFSRRTLDRVTAVALVKGSEHFLRTIGRHLPLYLASVTPAEDLTDILERRDLRHWFRAVYGCPPWTKADAIRDVLAREALAPDTAVLVGDSAGDQRAARETGVRFLARYSGLPFESPQPTTVADMDEAMHHLMEWMA